VVVELVIQSLHIADHAARWGDAPRRLANLDAMVRLAKDLRKEALNLARAATLSGLIAHLDQLAADEADMRLPRLAWKQ